NYTKENIARLENELDRLKEETEELDETLIFPPNGQSLMDSLRKRINELKERVDARQERMIDAKSKLDTQTGVVDSGIKRFQIDFPEEELYRFQDTSVEIEQQLEVERKKLDERTMFLQQENKRVDKLYQNIL